VLRLNGAPAPIVMEKGYAMIDRDWRDGDVVELSFPLPVRKVLSDPRLAENRGKAALQRGPIVYCVEARDADATLDSLTLGNEGELSTKWEPDLLGGVMVVTSRRFRAIPYYSWANRGAGPMKVWLRNGT
jgi:uncharacterized protein